MICNPQPAAASVISMADYVQIYNGREPHHQQRDRCYTTMSHTRENATSTTWECRHNITAAQTRNNNATRSREI